MKNNFKNHKKLPKEILNICKLDEPMKNHTTIKIGGQTKYFFEPQDEKQLQKILKFCVKNNIKNSIVGNGSNILFSSLGYNGAIIKIGKNFSFFYKNAIKNIKKVSKILKKSSFHENIKYFFCCKYRNN